MKRPPSPEKIQRMKTLKMIRGVKHPHLKVKI
jgi:hypothetical protein